MQLWYGFLNPGLTNNAFYLWWEKAFKFHMKSELWSREAIKFVKFYRNGTYWSRNICRITFANTDHSELNWSKVVPIQDFPGFWDEKASISQIVGRVDASPNDFPYMASLFLQVNLGANTVFCGGSIISTTAILTAAQCLSVIVSTRAASNISDNSELTQQSRTFSSYIIHDDYDPSTLDNDICISRIRLIELCWNPCHIFRLGKHLEFNQHASGLSSKASSRSELISLVVSSKNSVEHPGVWISRLH